MRIQIKLITVSGFFFLNFLLCKSVNLICNRQYNLASWLSFNHSAPFLLKCREDITRRGDATHTQSQITIVSGLEEWMSKCNRLSCILNGLYKQPKQHLLANGFLILKWLLKKLLDEIIDYLFHHFLPDDKTLNINTISNITEKLLKFN